jgi:hypothetical protein
MKPSLRETKVNKVYTTRTFESKSRLNSLTGLTNEATSMAGTVFFSVGKSRETKQFIPQQIPVLKSIRPRESPFSLTCRKSLVTDGSTQLMFRRFEFDSQRIPDRVSKITDKKSNCALDQSQEILNSKFGCMHSKANEVTGPSILPQSTKQHFMKVPKPSQQAGNSTIYPPTPDSEGKPIQFYDQSEQARDENENLGSANQVSGEVAKTPNAQYKTSKRRMTKMTKNPLMFDLEEDSHISRVEDYRGQSESSVNFKRAEGTGHVLEETVEASFPKVKDLSVQLKDLLNQKLTGRVVLDLKNLKHHHRPSVDLRSVGQEDRFTSMSSAMGELSQSSRSILIKPRPLFSASLGLAAQASNSPTKRFSFAARKKVAFAKNKMVLLFEKGL